MDADMSDRHLARGSDDDRQLAQGDDDGDGEEEEEEESSEDGPPPRTHQCSFAEVVLYDVCGFAMM